MWDIFATTIDFLKESPVLMNCLVFFYGLFIGSFLNVVIYRLPIMMNNEYISMIRAITELPDEILTSKMNENDKKEYYESVQNEKMNLALPASRCGSCGTKISIWHNIPVISYLLLRGRCAYCKQSYSPRYLFVELFIGLLWLFIYNIFSFSIDSIIYITLFTGLTASAFIDMKYRILPDSITFLGMALGLLFNLYSDNPLTTIENSILGLIFGYLGTYIFVKGYEKLRGLDIAMGEGDMKLYGLAGAFIGVESLIYLIILSTIIGLIQFILLLPFKKKIKEYQLPFGPAIIVALFIFTIFNTQIISFI